MVKYAIGYTTGVFDMFHIGHLNVLKNAKQYCDKLIVGVSTDELVMEYKKQKPIIPYKERIEIIKAIKFVDEVVPQTSMDKMEAWHRLHYNVLLHGDDWKGSSMYNSIEQELEAVNVKVIYLPHTTGTSSTMLREMIEHTIKSYKNV